MQHLPDLEAWAIFARRGDGRSRKPPTCSASRSRRCRRPSRARKRLGAMLLYRTSRKLSLTPTGELLRDRAIRLLADAELIESEASAQALEPHGLVRVNAPMSFGVRHLSPVLPAFSNAIRASTSTSCSPITSSTSCPAASTSRSASPSQRFVAALAPVVRGAPALVASPRTSTGTAARAPARHRTARASPTRTCRRPNTGASATRHRATRSAYPCTAAFAPTTRT